MAVPITPDQFRKDFPVFQNRDKYDDSAVNFWLGLSYAHFFNQQRWGDTLNIGVEMFVAHQLVLEAMSLASVTVDGNPGEYTGAIAAESGDKVSVNYDTNGSLDEGAGHWNLTTYGKRYIRMARMIGAGGLQLGIGVSPLFNGPAWPGPLTSIVPNPDG